MAKEGEKMGPVGGAEAAETVAAEKERAEAAKEIHEKAVSALDALNVTPQAEKAAAELGIINPEAPETPKEPAKALDDALEKIDERGQDLEKLWDRLCAVFWALFGIKPDELSSAIKSPSTLSQQEPEYEKDEADEEDASGKAYATRNLRRAKDIKRKLESRPAGLEHSWHEYIETLGSKRWKIPEGYMVSLIEMESGFDTSIKNPKSSALGLAQAMPNTIDEYIRERYTSFKTEMDASQFKKEAAALPAASPDGQEKRELFKNPLVAIDFIGFHMRKKIREANAAVKEEHAPESYKLKLPEDGWDSKQNKWYYMAYNSGGLGYVKLRRYLEEKSEEHYAALTGFQKKQEEYDGKKMESWEGRSIHSERVADIAELYETMDKGAEQFVAKFDSPPLPGNLTLTSGFGHRIHPIKGKDHFHNGTDYGAPEGTPVLSVLPGRVAKTASDNISGNYVVIEHENGTQSLYLHLSKIDVTEGDTVTAGYEIGKVGKTGSATGPHLHFMFKDANGAPHDASLLIAQAA